nr:hypothetical protein [Candidatus Woesearchaeota archaeon]
MKKYLLIIISLIALSFVLAGCGDNIAGEAVRGGRGAVDVAPVVQYETGNWAYLKNDKTYSIETSCTEAGSVGKPWAKMMEGGFSCYKSGGKEGVDWKYCDLDRQGNPSTYGIAINNWAYLTNDGKYTIQEGCTEAGSTGKPWGLMKTGGYPCYLSGGKQGVDWMYCPKVEGYDLSLTYGIELGMTKLMFDETLKHSLIIASDLVRFKHTFPNKEINVNNPEEMFNTMYFGINTKEKAQNLVDHLVFENVQKLLNVKFDL